MARQINIRLVFQQRLREARLRTGLSQKDLGIEAGLDPFVASTRINRYEVGVHEPDLSLVSRLAQVLGVPTAYLFCEDDRLARLILAFDGLSIAEKERLLKSLESKKSKRKSTVKS
ncbi:XRE family transcriptional regulator [Dyella dinghuensis]|uniref:XRE family transcriptional regulator n=1 Tax=Dyella dinghuensis TaxID=1920169 RepID=A0A432LZ05_9GAMM|nr:helix-turn-helix transcriptional regulator [Dyella dinghuensis]RUL66822.1 XRE family transcriptional regulator [Dyella dinghuensis]